MPVICSEFAGLIVTSVFFVLKNWCKAGKMKKRLTRIIIEPITFDVEV
jgi:hypothetical protein